MSTEPSQTPESVTERAWRVTDDDVESIALGAGILGTGGGGNPYLGKLRLWQELRRGGRAMVVPAERVPDDAWVATVGGIGAPTVGIERLAEGYELVRALSALETQLGGRIGYLIAGEIGGANSLAALLVAAQTGRIAVDGDGMGRAFPELQMDTFSMGGVSVSPLALSDVRGQTVVIAHAEDAPWAERIGRAVAMAMGGAAGMASHAMRGDQMKRTAIAGTLSFARRLGQVVRRARAEHADVAEAIAAATSGRVLFRGKVTDVMRRTQAGFARGAMLLRAHEGLGEMRIEFQNENLIAEQDGRVVAMVPDLLTLVTEDDGEPVGTEVLRYGLRVAVLGMPCAPELRSERALAVVGPRAFGYDLAYAPLAGRWMGGEG